MNAAAFCPENAKSVATWLEPAALPAVANAMLEAAAPTCSTKHNCPSVVPLAIMTAVTALPVVTLLIIFDVVMVPDVVTLAPAEPPLIPPTMGLVILAVVIVAVGAVRVVTVPVVTLPAGEVRLPIVPLSAYKNVS